MKAHGGRPTTTTTNHRQPVRRSRLGAVTVEFAVVAPIVFTVFLGGLELTTMNLIRHNAANAAYEGARRAVIPGGTAEAARTEASSLLQVLGVENDVTVDVDMTNQYVEVTVTVPVAKNSWGLSRFTGGFTVTKSCRLTREQAL